MKIISASIDLSKIDKTKISKFDKDGNPHKNGAQYYSIDIIVNDEKNKFGQDTSISTAQSKEERENKVPKVYLGNGKTVFEKGGSNQGGVTESTGVPISERGVAVETKKIAHENDFSDLPF